MKSIPRNKERNKDNKDVDIRVKVRRMKVQKLHRY